MKDPGEAAENEEIFDLLFDQVVDQNITYTIKNFEALGRSISVRGQCTHESGFKESEIGCALAQPQRATS